MLQKFAKGIGWRRQITIFLLIFIVALLTVKHNHLHIRSHLYRLEQDAKFNNIVKKRIIKGKSRKDIEVLRINDFLFSFKGIKELTSLNTLEVDKISSFVGLEEAPVLRTLIIGEAWRYEGLEDLPQITHLEIGVNTEENHGSLLGENKKILPQTP